MAPRAAPFFTLRAKSFATLLLASVDCEVAAEDSSARSGASKVYAPPVANGERTDSGRGAGFARRGSVGRIFSFLMSVSTGSSAIALRSAAVKESGLPI